MEYALGVVAAALLGASFVLQQGAAQRVPSGDFLRLRLVADLLRQPRWLAGFGTMIGGQLLSAWVIGHIILAVAEPLLATNLLIALGLAWPLLLHREWLRTARIAVIALGTLTLQYSYYGFGALKPLFGGLDLATLPSPWRLFELAGQWLGVSHPTMATLISCLWPIALLLVAWLIYQRISADQPREVVAPFALTYAWILVAPWVFAWYTGIAWVALTQVPRNRMTRWLTIVTVFLALCHSSGGQTVPGPR